MFDNSMFDHVPMSDKAYPNLITMYSPFTQGVLVLLEATQLHRYVCRICLPFGHSYSASFIEA